MAEEIINRVAKSTLITIDIEDIAPKESRQVLDISIFLKEGILREKDFREELDKYHWEKFRNTYVAILPLYDIIVPSWTYALVGIYLSGIALHTVVGNLEHLEQSVFEKLISELDISIYSNKPVIIKGCSNQKVPEIAYVLLCQRLKDVAKHIMYGESCSTVPLYKARRN